MPTKNNRYIRQIWYKNDDNGKWKPLTQTEIVQSLEDNAVAKTGDILKRNGKCYEVIIADSNIFVICRIKWSNRERSYITKYNRPEVYANQCEINTLEELGFEKI